MNLLLRLIVRSAIVLACVLPGATGALDGQSRKIFIPFADAQPILEALRADLLPPDLRDRTAVEREAAWPAWIAARDAAIRARVADGDEDSVVHLLLYGTSFTTRPPISETKLAGALVRTDPGREPVFVPSPLLTARIGDFIGALRAPQANERWQFAREVIERRGIDVESAAGPSRLRQYLEERAAAVGRADRTSRLLDAGTELADRLTIFRDRGLASDTLLSADFGIDRALEAMKIRGVVRPGGVRRVAVIGPGLDFVDKQHGHDFYPPQTIQPFLVVDSLARLQLADPAGVQVTAFDLSPRVLRHIDAACGRARAGAPYTIVLPRDPARPWSPGLIDYWRRVGGGIGSSPARLPQPPPNAGRVEVRGIAVRPPVVLSVLPLDLNIVTERLAAAGPDEKFDLVIATNVLLYYDVVEQSLASVNIARMLRPGGILLTNNRIFELPGNPLTGIGFTDVVYASLPGVGEAGDRVIWYAARGL